MSVRDSLLSVALGLLVALSARCACDAPLGPGEVVGDGFAAVVAVDSSHVRLTFTRAIDRGSAVPGAFSITDYTVVPPLPQRCTDRLQRRTISIGTIRQQHGDLSSGASHRLGIFGEGRADQQEMSDPQCPGKEMDQLGRPVAN